MRIIVKGMCQRRHELRKGAEIALRGGLDRLLDAVIAGDAGGVGGLHRANALRLVPAFGVNPCLPARKPWVQRRRVDAFIACAARIGARECAKDTGEIGAGLGHARQKLQRKLCIARRFGRKAQLGAQHPMPRGIEAVGKAVDGLCKGIDPGVTVCDQGQKCRRQLRKVPDRDLGLVGIGVAAELVDGGKHPVWMVGIHEGARTVIDGLAR